MVRKNKVRIMDEYYCSNCKKPVKEDETICPHCGAGLGETVEELDEQSSVVIKTFTTMFEAEAAQEYLLGCGVDSYISKDDAGGMYPLHSSSINNIRMLVLESKAEEALEALESLENNEFNDDGDEEKG